MKGKLILLAILYFPGTVLHELSHFVAAKVCGVQTGRINLTPRFTDRGMVLGSVEIARTDFVRHFLVGVAPLITGLFILGIITYVLVNYSLPIFGYVLSFYGIITVLNTMDLSRSDLPQGWIIVVILLLALIVLSALH